MIKKTTILIFVAVIIISLANSPSAYAGSASVSISGPSSVSPGGSATYTVTVNFSDTYTALATVSCGGAFSGGSANISFESGDASGNGSGSRSASITVRASSSGGTGTISVSGQGSTIDASYNVTKFSISGSKSVSVPAPTPAPTAEPTPTSAPAPTKAPTAAPAATPTPKPTATKAPSNGTGEPDATDATTPEPTPDAAATPIPTPALMTWQQVGSLLEGDGASQISEPVIIDNIENAQMPGQVLASIKESGRDVEIHFDGYICSIKADMLTGDIAQFEQIDLSVGIQKDQQLSSMVGGGDVYQLHFAHEGQLPGVFSYRIKAEGKSPGDLLYVYYLYELSGVIEAKQRLVVDDEGYISIDICHCSSYVIMDAPVPYALNNFTEQQGFAAAAAPVVQSMPHTVETIESRTKFMVPLAAYILSLAAAILISVYLTIVISRIAVLNHRKKRGRS